MAQILNDVINLARDYGRIETVTKYITLGLYSQECRLHVPSSDIAVQLFDRFIFIFSTGARNAVSDE